MRSRSRRPLGRLTCCSPGRTPRLIELVARFESAAGIEPSGGYGGVVHVRQRLGPLDAYYLGAAHQWNDDAFVELLWPTDAAKPDVGRWRQTFGSQTPRGLGAAPVGRGAAGAHEGPLVVVEQPGQQQAVMPGVCWSSVSPQPVLKSCGIERDDM